MSTEKDEDEAYGVTPHPFDYISKDAVQDLWGIGYTIVKRAKGDPFDVPPGMVPATRSYQWMHLVHDQMLIYGTGWAAVPASRHDGYFMPFGTMGSIEISGLGLFEKPKFEVDAEHAASHAKAHKNVSDWAEKSGQLFSGSFTVGGVEAEVGNGDIFASSKNNTIETTVKIPKDMIPHMAAIFEERDRMVVEQLSAWRNSDAEPTDIQREITRKYNVALGPAFEQGLENGDWPTLHATVLPYAIDKVREQLKEGEKS